MTVLTFFWSSPEAARVRLALSYKGVPFSESPIDYQDDETFFELGIGRKPFALKMLDGRLITDSVAFLESVDNDFSGPSLWRGIVDATSWRALLDWRQRADPILARLYAPVLPACRDIGARDETLQAYKLEARRRFGMTLEELANDRYSGFAQLDRITRFKDLGAHLTNRRFYLGQPSSADMLLAADLFPLQLLDGVSLPMDLLYYLERVEKTCQCNLRDGLIAG